MASSLYSVILAVACFLLPHLVAAQDTQSLSVSPTLFEMSANPGQQWSSNLRLINPNPYELHLYVSVTNFAPLGESGQGQFLSVSSDEATGQTIAEWVAFKQREVVVPPEQTVNLAFTVDVPEGAQPGGHFAAIMVGTLPLDDSDRSMKVETSQVVTSLLFLRVAGDVREEGSIRSFRPEHALLDRPEATFELRFENTGNVHLQPQGEIKILNMWGQERGIVPVNRRTMFGNVLPESIRKYTFSWEGEWSLADIGRYTAIATLAYGSEGRQFTSSETSFWVIPWKILLGVFLFLASFVAFMVWAVKLYVRKMLSMAGVTPELHQLSRRTKHPHRHRVSVVAPLEAGMLDLRSRISDSGSWRDRLCALRDFISNYRLFFAAVLLLCIFTGSLVWYISSASVSERGYEVTITGAGSGITISSEQVEYDKRKAGVTVPVTEEPDEEFPAILMVNQSGVSGLAADLRLRLEAEGYTIERLTTSLDKQNHNTVIVYAPEFAEEALELSQHVKGALLSSYAAASGTETPITIYVGRDLENGVQ